MLSSNSRSALAQALDEVEPDVVGREFARGRSAQGRGDCEICDERALHDKDPGVYDSPSSLQHPWHLCQFCDNTMRNWPHRQNHYAKHHPDHNPRVWE